MKKILFGIALMMFGLFSFYISVQMNWLVAQLLGLLLPVAGLVFAIEGYFEKGE